MTTGVPAVAEEFSANVMLNPVLPVTVVMAIVSVLDTAEAESTPPDNVPVAAMSAAANASLVVPLVNVAFKAPLS